MKCRNFFENMNLIVSANIAEVNQMEGGGPPLEPVLGLSHARQQEKHVFSDKMEAGLGLSIARQAELVFSDTAISRDAFLLKHIRRNRCGHLITDFTLSAAWLDLNFYTFSIFSADSFGES